MVPRFWLAYDKLPGLRPASGALPVPLRLRDCGLVLALSVILTEADRVPGDVGEKVTLIVQVPPAATGLPQVLVWAKSPEFAPATTRFVIFNVMLPVLVSVLV